MNDELRDDDLLSEEELIEMAQKGELDVDRVDQPSVSDTFTGDNFLKFIKGEITWAQLEGMTIDEAYAMAEMGYTFLEQGRIEDAKTIIEGLVIGNPYDAHLHALLGTIYAREDNEEDAVEEFSISLGLDPENVDAAVALRRASCGTGSLKTRWKTSTKRSSLIRRMGTLNAQSEGARRSNSQRAPSGDGVFVLSGLSTAIPNARSRSTAFSAA